MKRILEPEVMDSPQEAIVYDAMDHGQVNGQFVDDLLCHLPLHEDLEILDIGTGTALIPLALCRRHDRCHVLAIDMAQSMLRLAASHIAAAGMQGRVDVECIDAKRLPYADQRFSVVMSNSILHHIPRPEEVVAQSVRVLQVGGLIFFRDLLRPDNLEQTDQLVTMHAGAESELARQLFRDSLMASLTLDEVQRIVMENGFAPESVQATSDRHWTWIGRRES